MSTPSTGQVGDGETAPLQPAQVVIAVAVEPAGGGHPATPDGAAARLFGAAPVVIATPVSPGAELAQTGSALARQLSRVAVVTTGPPGHRGVPFLKCDQCCDSAR
jgi:hypothetical protein